MLRTIASSVTWFNSEANRRARYEGMISCLTCATCVDITGIALIALAALELSGDPVHEPVHADGRRRLCPAAILGARLSRSAAGVQAALQANGFAEPRSRLSLARSFPAL